MVDGPTTPEADFGAELRRLRERAGLTVRALANDLHRAHSGLVEYEGGRRLPGVDVVEQYEDYFGLERGTLLAQRERARAQRLEDPRDGLTADGLGEVACPYVGLRAFELGDAALFFGREALVEDAVARLSRRRFVAVVGASGAGKSSFVRAGILAGLRATTRRHDPRVVLLTPGSRPLHALATAVEPAPGSDLADGRPPELSRLAREGGGRELVVVVDQLEELFTLCADEAERVRFVDVLLDAWRQPASPVMLIVALRADCYGRVAAYPELAALIVAEQTLIGPLGARDLRRAIELPAAQSGLVLQDGLVETLLEDLAGEPGALPLMSHALLETWKRRRRLMLTIGGYRAAGGVRGAIAETAERTLLALPADDRAIVRSIFLRLTDVREDSPPAGRRVERGELIAGLGPDGSADRVLELLADARLVTLDAGSVAVAHEAVIRHWPRLRGWIDSDRTGLRIRRRLIDAAREWDSLDREPGALYRGSRLAMAREWASDHAGDLGRREQDFLSASTAGERRELDDARRRGRRLGALACAMAGLAAAVALIAAWAIEQRAAAQREARATTSLTLAAAASKLLDSRPDAGLLLAFEAYRASPRAEARSSVVDALLAARGRDAVEVLRGRPDGDRAIALGDEGTLAAAGPGHAIRVWDIDRRVTLPPPLVGHAGSVTSLAFSPDRRRLASASTDRTIRLWNAVGHEQVGPPLTGGASVARGLAFLRDGGTLVAAGSDGTIRLWDLRTLEARGPPLALSDFVVAFAGREPALASGLDVPPEAFEPGGDAVAAALAPDLRTVAIGAADGTIRLRDARTLKPIGVALASGGAPGASVAFSDDGRLLVAGAADGTARLWDVASHKQLGQPLAGRGASATSVRFSPDGRSFAAMDARGTIRLWRRALWRDVDELRVEVCRLAGPGMSPATWAQHAAGIPYRRSCP